MSTLKIALGITLLALYSVGVANAEFYVTKPVPKPEFPAVQVAEKTIQENVIPESNLKIGADNTPQAWEGGLFSDTKEGTNTSPPIDDTGLQDFNTGGEMTSKKRRKHKKVKAPEPIEEICEGFEIKQGLLKRNLVDALALCNYTIGQWGLGDEHYEYDIEIAKDYSAPDGTVGLQALLALIEKTYLLQGTPNSLDRTVDFQNGRGDVMGGMDIKNW